MSEEWFEKLKSDVRDFFKTATEADINQALKESGYDFYKNVAVPILDFHEKSIFHELIGTVSFEEPFINKFILSSHIIVKGSISFKDMKSLIAEDSYGYAMAA